MKRAKTKLLQIRSIVYIRREFDYLWNIGIKDDSFNVFRNQELFAWGKGRGRYLGLKLHLQFKKNYFVLLQTEYQWLHRIIFVKDELILLFKSAWMKLFIQKTFVNFLFHKEIFSNIGHRHWWWLKRTMGNASVSTPIAILIFQCNCNHLPQPMYIVYNFLMWRYIIYILADITREYHAPTFQKWYFFLSRIENSSAGLFDEIVTTKFLHKNTVS